MQKIVDLGTITVKHVSNMAETDKGFSMPAGNTVNVGDQLIEVDGKRKFVSKEEFPEIRKEIAKQEKEAPKANKPGKNNDNSAALIAAQDAVDAANANALKEKEEADAAKAELAEAKEKLAALESSAAANAEGAK